MACPTSEPDRDLVHLITYLACSPPFRDAVLNMIAGYLEAKASHDEQDLAATILEQERTVLGPVCRRLAARFLDLSDRSRHQEHTEALAIKWLFDELTAVGGLEVELR